MYAVKETVAALAEELEFTLNYAEALGREKHYRAAAEVIEEQRLSLARASERMERAVSEPEPTRKRARIRVALAGVAAALALASSAFAAFGPAAHQRTAGNTKIEAVDQATLALAKATGISDPATLQQIVTNAQETILEVAQSGPSDPRLKSSLLASVENLQKFIHNPNVPARVREQAKRVAETVQKIVVSPDSSTPQPSAAATPAPPATPPPS